MASPLGAVLEQVLPGLDAVLAPPAGDVWAAGGPSQILTGQSVPGTLRLWPIEKKNCESKYILSRFGRPSYFRRAYIATATALVGGLQGFMLWS